MSVALRLAFALALGCGGPAPLVQAPAASEPPMDDRPVALTLDRADAAEVLVVMERLVGHPVLVEASALSALRCATVSVDEHGLTATQAADKLAAVLRTRGFQVDHGRSEWRVALSEKSPAACPTQAPEATAAQDPPVDATAEIIGSIREISPTEHAITRHALDLMLEHQADVFKDARIVPEANAGKVTGIRVFGVRPDSVLGHLGFQNGDRIDGVMGHPVSDPEKALEAYAAARTASVVDVEVVRGGGKTKLLLRIE
jgi:type II secretory pathway component PulC